MMEKHTAQLAANAYYEARGLQGVLHQESPIVAYQKMMLLDWLKNLAFGAAFLDL